ncbi:MAG TPA: choice-of-anchor tandem repeat GloVer-containing protein [Terriglobales bacterium]|jgi:hypothetical protein|nr:choice-of-anchor tandem repeat GloVer-containing protein [Terriglobales bacterium]
MTCKRYSQSAIGLLSFFVAVFALTVPASAEWKEKVLYSFQGSPDGSFPGGGLVFDKAGNLYGVTLEGGSGSCPPAQCGIVYQLSPPAQKGGPWTETVLYVFKGQHYGDGSSPAGTLLIDSSGNLYGGTGYGGTGKCMIFGGVVGCGTVYELSPPKKQGEAWTEKVLYSFKGGKDGQLAGESLTFDTQGNIYGATAYGGGYGSCNEPYYQHCGAIYELSPPQTKGGKWTEKVLHGFKSGKDGANPNGGLVLDNKGAIYGTTYAGGNQDCKYGIFLGCGTVFELKPPSDKSDVWTEKQLHVFQNKSDGGEPNGGLIFDSAGSLYGTVQGGNISGGGIVFRLTVGSGGRWQESVLHWFSNSGGGAPSNGVIFDSAGNIYGTTDGGDAGSYVFSLSPERREQTWTLSILHIFKGIPDGAGAATTLVFDTAGNLYSTTQRGGTGPCQGGCGTVAEVEP